VRDLHDGAQQRMVQTVVTLKLASERLASAGDEPARALVDEALEQASRATSELRELAHGILPAVLTRGGLRSGVEALAARMPLPVSVAVPAQRFPAAVEATAYFVIAEALTNVAKHARARRAWVSVDVRDERLELRVRDDGAGGAVPGGRGLLGMEDRLAALDGRLSVDSAAGRGTSIGASIPLARSVLGAAHVGQDGEDPAMLGGALMDI
jgi:signal transduction histidine kinase